MNHGMGDINPDLIITNDGFWTCPGCNSDADWAGTTKFNYFSKSTHYHKYIHNIIKNCMLGADQSKD